MSNQLQENLDAILLDKNTNLLPENLKQGVTCLGVEGTLNVLDTSDGNAVSSDILEGKIAYNSNGKVIGSIKSNFSDGDNYGTNSEISRSTTKVNNLYDIDVKYGLFLNRHSSADYYCEVCRITDNAVKGSYCVLKDSGNSTIDDAKFCKDENDGKIRIVVFRYNHICLYILTMDEILDSSNIYKPPTQDLKVNNGASNADYTCVFCNNKNQFAFFTQEGLYIYELQNDRIVGTASISYRATYIAYKEQRMKRWSIFR